MELIARHPVARNLVALAVALGTSGLIIAVTLS